MKETSYTKAVDRVIELKMKAVDKWLAAVVEPLEKIGSPEALVDMKYEDWPRLPNGAIEPMFLQTLAQAYGTEPNPLSKLLARKELERVEAKERMVL